MLALSTKTRLAGLALLCSLITAVCRNAAGQPTPGEAKTLYVDQNAPRASDNNPGSRDAPLITIQAAVNLAARELAHNIPMRIVVAPGVYREAITIAGLSRSDAPSLTIEAQTPARTVVSGADVWSGWHPSGPLLAHSWPYDWGVVPNPRGWPALEPMVRRREMVFVNDRLLEQSLTLPLSKPGTFAVEGGSLVVYLPTGVDTQSATIEVATRPVLLKASGRANNLRVSGLRFERANTGAGYGTNAAVVLSGSNLTLENCKFNYNNWVGLSIANSDRVRLLNCAADYNGENGVSMWRVSQLEAINLSTSGNNWRGAAGNFLGWDADGFKALSLHDANFLNYRALNNQTGGMWLDTDNVNVVIRGAVVSHNLTNGFFFEKSQGPILIQGSKISRNRDSGIQGSYSTNVSLVDDLICGNEVTQLRIAGRDGVARISDHWSGQAYQLSSAHWTIDSSKLIATGGDQGLIGTYLRGSWPIFTNTLTTKSNRWESSRDRRAPSGRQLENRDPRTWLKDDTSSFAEAGLNSCPE